MRRPVDDLGKTIREVSSFAARGTSVRCDVEVIEPLGIVEVDVGQVAQVIQNLVLNACQASRSGATVTVRAWREMRGEDGPRVLVEVIDSGTGIAPEHLQRIFEPFFTARVGGTGLGLTVSHSIIQRHGGSLGVKSEVGRGTTFTVELPGSDRVLPTEGTAERRMARFSGRALVMDDDDAVRRVAELLLVQLGFEVEAVADGAAALTAARRANGENRPFRIAVLDLTIVGGLGAAEIAGDLRSACPGIRIVISTGYARDGDGGEWDARLQKPFGVQDLSIAVESALETS
jgi:CheY-like chemotaxis protein